VLRAVALILTSVVDELGSIDDFIGHPSEGQFLIVTVPAKSEALARQIRDRLGQAMVYFYPIHDREAGLVVWGGDQVQRTKVPFMDVVATIVLSTDGPFKDIQSLRRALAHGSS
jgi:hypothetical protein